ncbi:DEAD/DEAH box helicase [Microbaculum marinum]|uniref:DEAD/DEAH box helicase n=1 Tax=Microbaculum marinum TaxID=1764581 RepID=A0AAW9RT59_9HYPH
MNSELRPHQIEAMSRLRQSLVGGRRRPMIQAPTGFGKTILAAAIVDGALRKGNRVTFVVPALSLIDQTVQSFWAEGIRDVGVIQANHEMTNASRPVQVASVQTLQRRELPEADVVVIDEAHRWYQFYADWMARPEWSAVPFVGLSATPWTKGLGRYFDDLIVAATTAKLIDAGYLSPFRVFAPAHPDLTGVRTVAGDYHEGDLSDAIDKPDLTADIVETWRKLGEDRPTLVFAVDRAHARHLAERFSETGVATAYVDAFTDSEERETIRRRFHAGDVQVVVNIATMIFGVDWDVRCIVFARPTKSEMLWVQAIGRGLRTAPGKADLIVLDHSDTALRLGLPTDIQHDRLNEGRKGSSKCERERSVPLPKECPSCTFLKPPGLHTCPSCGFAPERRTEVATGDGELVEIGKRGSKLSAAERRNRTDDWSVKVSFIQQLKRYAQDKGRSPGWVAHAYREYYGCWPNDRRLKDAEPAAGVGEVVRSWIRAKDIRYAKARGRAA